MESVWTRRSPDLSRNIEGATAVITGAGSGLGRALAVEAASRGMRLVLIDASTEGLRQTVDQLPQEAVLGSEVVDVRSPEGLRSIAAGLASPPLLVFANAGVLSRASLMDQEADDIRRILEINVMGAVHTIQAFAPAMLAADRPSRIIITGSQGSFVSFPGLGAYGASKHAVLAIAETLAEEWAGAPVSVAVLAPGGVATAILGAEPSMIADRLMPPTTAARLAFEGALDGRFLISTHADLAALAAQRASNVARALA
ncbi:SDR family NAD(P)-dependent oxidoreductase [Brevundimonas sp.]|uniref:SDR family NAD(P)-dependent oxidoreductase n=1 Tax=Brevundimonas sp. TaxID=1871086 RepID=UPI003D6C8A40